jgi:hypothetical protein
VSFFPVIASEARQFMDRFVPRDDLNRGWIASCLSMTGEGAVSFFPVIASEARQSIDRFVPRDDMKRSGSLRASR